MKPRPNMINFSPSKINFNHTLSTLGNPWSKTNLHNSNEESSPALQVKLDRQFMQQNNSKDQIKNVVSTANLIHI